MKSPNLIIPGAPKAGTSSLHYYLNQHPDINMSTEKEPHIYSFEDRYKNRFNPEYENSFTNIFDWDKSYKYHGESSTSYWVMEKVPERIFKNNPNCKIIILLRDPIERIISHYNWLFSLGQINLSFKEEVNNWLNQEYSMHKNSRRYYKYYDLYSRYGTLSERYLKYFNKDQIFIIEFEQMKINVQKTINEVYNFLGLDEVAKIEEKIINKSKKRLEKLPFESNLKWLWKIVPKKVKQSRKIQNTYKKIFHPTIINVPKPAEEDIIWLKDLLEDEITKLKLITGFSPKLWQNFK